MDVSVIDDAMHPLVTQAARLHLDALSYRSTITMFGERFLAELYRALLDEKNGFVVAAHEAGELRGFILGSVDSTRMMSAVPRRWRRFLPLMAPALLTRPLLWPRLFQTLFYTRKEGVDVHAELVVIAVVDSLRGKGVGRQLLQAFDNELSRRGIPRYKVTVHDAMTDSNRFYTQNGFQLASQFSMYGVPWNLYVQDVKP